MNKDNKQPSALDYIIVHHVCRAYMKSVEHLEQGDESSLFQEIYQESIAYLVEFITSHEINNSGLSDDAKAVIRLVRTNLGMQKENDQCSSIIVLH